MIVMKFGGTSVANAEALRQVASIVTSHAPQHHGTVVVLSATSGTTSKLIQLVTDAAAGSKTDDAFRDIASLHLSIATELGIDNQPTKQLLDQLKQHIDAARTLKECPPQSLDAVTAFGELLSTTLFHQYLQALKRNVTFVDARKCIVTDDTYTHGQVDIAATLQQTLQHLGAAQPAGSIIVTQGFIAATSQGITTTLGRGGSDYSAAIIGSALKAQEIQIWTDVSGVYTCDPRIVPSAKPLESISFENVRLLSRYGAKVLHPETVEPAIRAGIPVRVLNTFKPEASGTVITAEATNNHAIIALARMQPCTRIQTDDDGVLALTSIDLIKRHVALATTTRNGNTIVVHTAETAVQRAIELAAVGNMFQRDEVACIALAGTGVNDPRIVGLVAKCLEPYQQSTITTLLHPPCILATVALEMSVNVCNALHALVSSSSSSSEAS